MKQKKIGKIKMWSQTLETKDRAGGGISAIRRFPRKLEEKKKKKETKRQTKEIQEKRNVERNILEIVYITCNNGDKCLKSVRISAV